MDIQAAKKRGEAASNFVHEVVRTGEWPEDNVDGWEFMGKVADALDDLPAALEALERVENFADDHYKDGVCLICGAPADNHKEMSPACWVLRLDSLLTNG